MDSAERKQTIASTHRLGVLSNLALAVIKLGVGILAGSRALLADGVHALSDVVMNGGAWIGWRLASRPRDREHHYGHGNIEALTTLGVALMVIGAGVALIWTTFRGQSTVSADVLGATAIGVELLSMAIKLGLARVTRKRGRELDSSILVALSRDNAADVLTSALIMFAIIGAILGQRWLEPLAAVCVAGLIIWQGLRSVREGLDVLLDRAPSPELTAQVAELAARVEGVHRIDDVRIHPLGTHLRVDLELAVDGTLAVHEGHAIAHRVEDAICKALPRIEEVAVHVNPV